MPPPQKKLTPTDVLGRPVSVGDAIAWPSLAGRSARMSTGRVLAIRYKRRGGYSSYENCEPDDPDAVKYTVTVQPVAASKTYYSTEVFDPTAPQGQRFKANAKPAKKVTIQKVENILRIDLAVDDQWGALNKDGSVAWGDGE